MARQYEEHTLDELASAGEQPGSQAAYDKGLEFRIRELELNQEVAAKQIEAAESQAASADRQAAAAERGNKTARISLIVTIMVAVITVGVQWLSYENSKRAVDLAVWEYFEQK